MVNPHIIRFILAMLTMTSIQAFAQQLIAGVWQGSFTNALGKRYEIYYSIEYSQNEQNQPSITMINMDLEPTPDYTYLLTDILLQENNLSFKIPRVHDTRICNLTRQDDDSYSGQCQSDKAVEGETSLIIMLPPENEN